MAATTAETSAMKPSPIPGVADTDLAKPDDIAPATDVAASGALIEPAIVQRIDTAPPAVDDPPRAASRVVDNLITFNDPTVPGHVQVARNLGLKDDYDAPAKVDAKA